MGSTYTQGDWQWTIHDHSCASLGVGSDPGMGTPLVMSVSPCRSCADRAKDGEWEWDRCTTPSEADARLISAAPNMLEALLVAKERLKTMEGMTGCRSDDDYVWEAQAIVNAAITKAIGAENE